MPALAASVLIAAGFVMAKARSSATPASYQLEPNAFVATGSQALPLWRQTFADRLEPGYTTSFPPPRMVHIRDLDGDGSTEVLFVQQPADPLSPDRGLWCFNHDGSVRWKYTVTQEVRTAAQSFPPPYRILQTYVGPLQSGGETKIVVSSVQVPWWAGQIAILDVKGKLEREYWHSGALFSLEVGDADGDGFSEVYAGGINNARAQATLIVLDPRTMEGASHERDPAYQLTGRRPPVEDARLFFPRTCAAAGQPYNALRQIGVQQGRILLEVWEHPYGPEAPSVFYTLTPQMKLQHAAVSDRFRIVHDGLRLSGAIDHMLTPQEIARLAPVR
jgi:hypothetical protein